MRHVCVFLSRIRAVVHSKCIWASHDALHSILVMFLLRFSLSLSLFFLLAHRQHKLLPLLLSPRSTPCANVSGNERQHLKRQALNWQIDGWFSLHVHGYMMYYYAGARRREGEEGGRETTWKVADSAMRNGHLSVLLAPPASSCACEAPSSWLSVALLFHYSFPRSFVLSFSFWFLRSVACFLFWLSFCSCNGARP